MLAGVPHLAIADEVNARLLQALWRTKNSDRRSRSTDSAEIHASVSGSSYKGKLWLVQVATPRRNQKSGTFQGSFPYSGVDAPAPTAANPATPTGDRHGRDSEEGEGSGEAARREVREQKKETATETATPKATTAKAASKKTSEKAAPRVPTHDEIAKLAHKYWAERGHHHGHAEQDWLRAERELTQNAE